MTTRVSLPDSVIEAVEHRVRDSEFDSVEEYITFVLSEVTSEHPELDVDGASGRTGDENDEREQTRNRVPVSVEQYPPFDRRFSQSVVDEVASTHFPIDLLVRTHISNFCISVEKYRGSTSYKDDFGYPLASHVYGEGDSSFGRTKIGFRCMA
jgi:Arc/MetJ-type ribon-helix-helix transcriptional regulator